MSAFFSFDKDLYPVFIDYCLMSHPDYTAQAIHLSTTHYRPFVAWNVSVCGFFFEFLPPDCTSLQSMSVFICECAACLCASKEHACALNTNPNLCSNTALIFCFMNRNKSA